MKFVIEDGRLTEYEGNTEKTQVVIPDCVTSIGDCAFSGCENLTEAVIPKSVTEIGKMAFDECPDLRIECTEKLKAKLCL